MYYLALATDYDGTLAHDGRVTPTTRAAMDRLKASGRKLILVTGRELPDLRTVCPDLDAFDRIVAENGALLYRPASREEVRLAPPPHPGFVDRLKGLGVTPLSVGRCIVATWEPHETVVLEAIREFGLELQITFNKGAVMVLPSGVNKASGMTAALHDLGLSPHNVAGVGDAENDHAFLSLCGCAVAVANALPSLKDESDWVTVKARGDGVADLIDRMIATDLVDIEAAGTRQGVELGRLGDQQPVQLRPHGSVVMVAGTSGGGKSTMVTALLERLCERGFQVCVVDPEGDYEHLETATVLGDAAQPPRPAQVLELLERPDQSVAANLLAIAPADRPAFLADLLPRLMQLRTRVARPHWIIIDEAHHMLPASWQPALETVPGTMDGLMLVTVHPDQVSVAALRAVGTLVAVGHEPAETIRRFGQAAGVAVPEVATGALEKGWGLVWYPGRAGPPFAVRLAEPDGERHRHRRKYAEGQLGDDKSFYFRGPDGRLNLRAQNLGLFVQIAQGVDDATWLHHLRRGDYSRWLRQAIKDGALADEVAEVERDAAPAGVAPDAQVTRERVRAAIERRYAVPG